MFVTRLISGIVLVILAFGAIWAGDLVLLATMYLVSLVGFRELTKAAGVNREKKNFNIFYRINSNILCDIYRKLCVLCAKSRNI